MNLAVLPKADTGPRRLLSSTMPQPGHIHWMGCAPMVLPFLSSFIYISYHDYRLLDGPVNL